MAKDALALKAREDVIPRARKNLLDPLLCHLFLPLSMVLILFYTLLLHMSVKTN
uniref:Uncharacterized protein n=1 Tax=Arundo donax TaxID=35708 RepID=A0A0A9FM55_ARUDO